MAYIHEGHGPALLANSIATLVITWLFSSIRVYVRWFMLKQWALEDWFFVTSQLSFTILATISLLAAFHGNGQHLADLKLADIPLAMEYLFIGEIVYTLTVILIRLSFGFFLLHICVKKVHVWTIKATMAIMSLLTFLYLFFLIFQCSPTDYFWLQFSGISGSCMPPAQVEALTVAYAAMLCVTDLIFGILPIFVIWNLKMNPKAKVVVGILLALGMLGGLTVAIRIRYLQLVNLTEDFLFATANISIWSMIEPAISICCVAASTFRPLFSALSEKTSFGGYSSNRLPLSNNKSANNNATGTVTSVLANAASRVSRGFRSEGKGWPLKGSGSQEHFKEGIALHSMATGSARTGRNELDVERDGSLEFGKDGIHVSKSIEITRERGTEADR